MNTNFRQAFRTAHRSEQFAADAPDSTTQILSAVLSPFLSPGIAGAIRKIRIASQRLPRANSNWIIELDLCLPPP
ncbi:MAG: hypothetical protein NTV29_03310 [Planctomycetota bacterium]|nr:hypothetical protein [Planctomycetota bacterium]